jgi:hypothetical protein
MCKHNSDDQPWYRRFFLDHPPPVPDHLWEFMLIVALFLVSMLLGLTLYVVRQESSLRLTNPVFQQYLNNIEQRLRALERR